MKQGRPIMRAVVAIATLACLAASAAEPQDPRLREVIFDPAAVVTVPVKRGTVTLIGLGSDESITEIASGLGADCAKPDSTWCVAAQPGGRTIFVKPKTAAKTANNLAVITDRRVHTFQLVVLPDDDPRPAVYRLMVRAPATPPSMRPTAAAQRPTLTLPTLELPEPVRPEVVVAERLQAKPQVLNTQYTMADGPRSDDIIPSLVFDDGKFTYLRFPGNREVPGVFHVLGDGSETLVNTRMEDDLLVVDRVSRHLMLRAGNAVVGLWNEAFDLDGVPPEQGTNVSGVKRALRAAQAVQAAGSKEVSP